MVRNVEAESAIKAIWSSNHFLSQGVNKSTVGVIAAEFVRRYDVGVGYQLVMKLRMACPRWYIQLSLPAHCLVLRLSCVGLH